jgi:hypothetical protein
LYIQIILIERLPDELIGTIGHEIARIIDYVVRNKDKLIMLLEDLRKGS